MAQTNVQIDLDLRKLVCKITLEETGKQCQFSRVVNEALRAWVAKKLKEAASHAASAV